MSGIDKKLKFETYSNDTVILSCTNNKTGKRLSKIPATILYILVQNVEKEVQKDDICDHIWNNHDYYTKRSFDVHMNYIKKLLEGTNFKVVVLRNRLLLTRMIKRRK